MYLTRRLGVIEILQVVLANLVDNEQLTDCFIGTIKVNLSGPVFTYVVNNSPSNLYVRKICVCMLVYKAQMVFTSIVHDAKTLFKESIKL